MERGLTGDSKMLVVITFIAPLKEARGGFFIAVNIATNKKYINHINRTTMTYMYMHLVNGLNPGVSVICLA